MSNLYKSLAEAQAKMSNAKLNKVNPLYKSKYADLPSIRDATLPALNNAGLSLVQYTSISPDGHGVVLHTRITDSSGEYIESAYPIAMDAPQKMGSALTYARRYCWAAMCGITADEDDDGNVAQPAPHITKEAGRYQGLTGPHKTMTTLRAAVRAISHDLESLNDPIEVAGLITDNIATIDQCKRDLPKWYEPDGDSKGLARAILDKWLDTGGVKAGLKEVFDKARDQSPGLAPITTEGE